MRKPTGIDREIIEALFLPLEIAKYVFSKTSLYIIGAVLVGTVVVAAPALA
jgi:hypothetical protein